jgi:hypothetical protein
MNDDVQVYDHPVLSAHARRLLTVVAAVTALLLGLVSPAHAADGHVTGTVTGEGTGPLSGVWVELYGVDDLEYADGDVTDALGKYDVAVPPGSYLVVFDSYDGDYEPELYDDVHDFSIEDATPVVVTGGAGSQADAELTRYATISGHLAMNAADPEDAVQVYDEHGDIAGWGFVEPDGSYEVHGLPTGSYRLAFNRLSGFAYSAAEFYDDHAEGGGLASGDVVTLASGEARTGVNAVLSEGGHVTGTLQDSDGGPIRCRLQAFTKDRTLVTRSGWSDPATGAFDITGLSTGSYLVRVVNGQGCKNGIQYLDGSGDPLSAQSSAADPVAVTLGAGTALAPALVYDLGPQPTNVVAPSVTGAPTVGAMLTANHGSWTPSSHLAYHYQWLADGVALPGATRRTYRATQADVGKAIAVRVTATRGASRTATVTSAATAKITGAPVFNLMPPTVVGSPSVNARMTVSNPGLWSASGLTYTYTWSTPGVVHQSSTSPVFIVPDAAYGLPLSVRVTATTPAGQSGQVDVLAAASVKTGRWDRGKPQRIKGGATIGAVVRVTYAKLKPEPGKPRCTWYRDSKRIPGARGKSYHLVAADIGHHIRVSCRYEHEHYEPLTFVSRLPREIHG